MIFPPMKLRIFPDKCTDFLWPISSIGFKNHVFQIRINVGIDLLPENIRKSGIYQMAMFC